MTPPRFDFRRRASGLLLHVTSLPGRHGSGDLSAAAFRFVDFLAAAGQSWWQMLPVGPSDAGAGYSPYSAASAVAGSPDLVSLETLRQEGWLTRAEVRPEPGFDAGCVQFPLVRAYRLTRLRLAWLRFRATASRRHHDFREFCASQRQWLDGFALYAALKETFGQAPWPDWPRNLRRRQPAALAEAGRALRDEADFHRWVQFQFHRQWAALRDYAHARGVGLLGDVPIFVAGDSADVWAWPELFRLDAQGRPAQVSGYPPDPSCRRGQRWGHPHYAWPAHRRSRFRWWVLRFAGAYDLFDAVRLDHFLGFTRTWSIPAAARSARQGRWVASPGRQLLTRVRRVLGDRPMIAEDLGHVTPADLALRDDFRLPAMRILQLGFDPGDPQHRPHRFTPQTVAYTGTHDTDTLVGWFQSLRPSARRQVLDYAGSTGDPLPLNLTRLLMNSAANTVITPVQDLLGLDGRARMNRPGTPTGNWHWRLPAGALTPGLARTLYRMTELAERLPDHGP